MFFFFNSLLPSLFSAVEILVAMYSLKRISTFNTMQYKYTLAHACIMRAIAAVALAAAAVTAVVRMDCAKNR